MSSRISSARASNFNYYDNYTGVDFDNGKRMEVKKTVDPNQPRCLLCSESHENMVSDPDNSTFFDLCNRCKRHYLIYNTSWPQRRSPAAAEVSIADVQVCFEYFIFRFCLYCISKNGPTLKHDPKNRSIIMASHGICVIKTLAVLLI
jgi:hypothetical protein